MSGSGLSASRAFLVGFVLLLVAQALAGLVLATRYDSDPAAAHASVAEIQDGPLRWIRSLHAWTADALLVTAVAAGAYVFLARPAAWSARIWLAGEATFAALLAAYLTGGVLTWDQQGWESYQHLAAQIPQAPQEPGSAPLGFVYFLHVVMLPAIVLASLIWIVGPRGVLPNRESLAWAARRWAFRLPAIALAILVAVAEPALGPAPIKDAQVSRPDWPFAWLTPLQDWWGPRAVWALPALLAAAAGAPWLTGGLERRGRTITLVAIASILGTLTLLGLLGT